MFNSIGGIMAPLSSKQVGILGQIMNGPNGEADTLIYSTNYHYLFLAKDTRKTKGQSESIGYLWPSW